jgi:hypothetical protein
VLLGTSRVMIGLDPQSPLLHGRHTYNAGLAGTNMYELDRVMEYLIRHQPALRQVIFGLDLLLFNADRTVEGDFQVSGFAGNSLPEVYGYTLVSVGTTLDSLATLRDNLRGARADQRLDGYMVTPPLGVSRPGSRDALARSLAGFAHDKELYGGLAAAGHYDAARLAMLRHRVAQLKARGVAVTLFISPIHAMLLETQRAMGLAPVYEAWKRDLTQMVDDIERHGQGGAPVVLWDFGTYNSITTEPVPAAGSDRTLTWYWEASHYRPAVGDLVLARMLQGGGPAVPADFGQRLTPAMLAAHLARQRAAATDYRCRTAADIAALVAPATAATRPAAPLVQQPSASASACSISSAPPSTSAANWS